VLSLSSTYGDDGELQLEKTVKSQGDAGRESCVRSSAHIVVEEVGGGVANETLERFTESQRETGGR